MTETTKDAIKREYGQRSQATKNTNEALINKREQAKNLQSDVDKYLADGGTMDIVEGFYGAWDNVPHKTRYNKRTKMYKPFGLGDGQG